MAAATRFSRGWSRVFLANTGAQINPASFFNRDAYVGITNSRFGSLSLGHIPDYVYEYVGALNNSVPGISSYYTVGNLDGLANTRALDNSVKYESIDYRGFQAGAMNAFGNQTNFSEGRQYSVGARYQNGRVKLGAAYSMSHNRTADLFGIFGVTSVLGQRLKQGTLFNADHYSTIAVGGSVVVGDFIPHATFTDVKLEDPQGSVTERNYQVGVNIDLSGGKRFYVMGISYNRSMFEGADVQPVQPVHHALSVQEHADLCRRRPATGPQARMRRRSSSAITAVEFECADGWTYRYQPDVLMTLTRMPCAG